MKEKFLITGMTCSACSAAVERSINKLESVTSVNVNLLANSMVVEYDDSALTQNDILEAVSLAGYEANLPEDTTANQNKGPDIDPIQREMIALKKRVVFSSVLLLPLLYLSMGHMLGLPLPTWLHGMENAITYSFMQFLLTVPIAYVNRNYFSRGFRTLTHMSPNMDSLIAIGSGAALIYGVVGIFQIGYGLGHARPELVERALMNLYFESAAIILTLITVGKYFEARSKGKTSTAISKLLDLAPKTATVIRDGTEVEIAIEDVQVGDQIVVKPGQSIPVDGVLIEGSSSIDQSALTGESIPMEKQIGDKVMAATINRTGYFVMVAEKVGDDTTLAKIIQLVLEAGASKAPIAKLADKISGVFVPVVIAISILSTAIWLLLGYSFEFALSIGISVLVISCPCALGLATPVAIMVGTGKGASLGILIKSAEALETTHGIDTVVFDKTGTLTEGKPRVTDLLPLPGGSSVELLSLAASLEKPSEHPLAEAIVERAKEEHAIIYGIEDFLAVPGRGITAIVKGQKSFAGNLAYMEENGISLGDMKTQADCWSLEGKTPLYFAMGQELMGMIAVSDVVKPTSGQAIKSLKSIGIDVIMMTGDNSQTAGAIQRQLDIDRVIAEVLPSDKEREVSRLQESGRRVAMVGDGINDSPALTRADVGIAIGAGTDIAIESADIVLMKNDLLSVVTAIELSKATIRNIKQNLFWAFFYNALGIPLAAGIFYPIFGWTLSPMFAAAAMSTSSVFVVTNALRLRWFQPTFSEKNNQSDPHSTKDNLIEKEGTTMKQEKIIEIGGMTCGHCQARVLKALSGIDGVIAEVDLENQLAKVTLLKPIEDSVLRETILNAGYEVGSITDR